MPPFFPLVFVLSKICPGHQKKVCPAQISGKDRPAGRRALHPLVHNRDGHFLATLSALLLSLLEGKTDCPISGVFGAGKTRAAAAIIAGLITVDPSLKIMILTKENVASQAFAEHIIGLSLPSWIWIETKIGRLVGFMALHNQTTGTTKLDIPSSHRHDVLNSKGHHWMWRWVPPRVCKQI